MANDPNTIQYVIQEDGFWYIASKDRTPGVPGITVSSKGIANGLSTEYNDGYDFGPDSYNPSVTSGVPLTQTSGIQEAVDYAIAVGQEYNQTAFSGGKWIPIIQLLEGYFVLNAKVFISPTVYVVNLKIIGKGSMSTYVAWDFDDNAIEIDHTNKYIIDSNIEIGYMQPWAGTTVGAGKAFFSMNYVSGDPAYQLNPFQSYDFDFSNTFSGIAALSITGAQSIFLMNAQAYNGGTYGLLYAENINFGVSIIGEGLIGGAYISSATHVIISQAISVNIHVDTILGGVFISQMSRGNLYVGNTPGGVNIDNLILGSIYVTDTLVSNIHIGNYSLDVGGDCTAFYSVGSTAYTVDNIIIDEIFLTTGTTGAFTGTGTNLSEITVNNLEIGNVLFQSTGALTGIWNKLPVTVSGTTAGSFVASQPEQKQYLKKVVIYLDGYENDSTTAQTYTFPVAFSTVAVITTNSASVPVVSTSLTEFSIAPDTTTAYTGIIVIEGY